VIEQVAEVLDVEHEARAMPVERIRQVLRDAHVDALVPGARERVPRHDLAAILVEPGVLQELIELRLIDVVEDDVAAVAVVPDEPIGAPM